ncbi:MAG: hypothetical protein WCN81_13195 [Actinomycetes bacterium]
MKKLLPVAVLVALVAVFILLAAGAALACPRAHPVLVMNVTYKVTNDEASGNVGYWALRDFTRHVQVWRMPDGSFSWESRFEGRWTTFAGALSPGAGVPQAANGWGRFEGVLNGTFTSDPYIPVRGYLGTYDAGGTKADVLLGTYDAGQTGAPDVWSPGDTYFPGAAASDDWGGWDTTAYSYTYRYRDQTFVWDGLAGTSTGDIVITR